jgi:hypothetical protein
LRVSNESVCCIRPRASGDRDERGFEGGLTGHISCSCVLVAVVLTKIAPDQNNPLNAVEQMAADHSWPFEHAGEDEIALIVDGRCTNYQISFTWMHEIEALHLACAFDIKVPETRISDVRQLIALINEDLWIGHFDLWTKSGMIMFRYALVLAGGREASVRQCEAVLGAALDSSERYFPAFQFVVWAGKSAREAMDSAMLETSGRA